MHGDAVENPSHDSSVLCTCTVTAWNYEKQWYLDLTNFPHWAFHTWLSLWSISTTQILYIQTGLHYGVPCPCSPHVPENTTKKSCEDQGPWMKPVTLYCCHMYHQVELHSKEHHEDRHFLHTDSQNCIYCRTVPCAWPPLSHTHVSGSLGGKTATLCMRKKDAWETCTH